MKSIYEFLLKSKTAVSIQGHDYVDFGLPSGLLWATCNVGANDPTEYGDYFMWGSIEPNTNDDCDWEHCPFNNSSYDYDEEYFKTIQDDVCPNGVLAPKYDAATAILGDDWRLPTYDDFQELIDNTEQEWIKNYKGSRINGTLLFKANDAELDTELFIPAAGFRSESGFSYRGGYAYLWSSSLTTSTPNFARYLYFNSSFCSMSYSNRYNGLCIRAVKKP